MHPSRQRQILLIGSLSLTALLLGTFAGTVTVSRVARQQMQDPEFLRQRLKEVSQEDAPKQAAAVPSVRVALAEEKEVQPQRPIVGRLVEVRKVTVPSEVTGQIVALPVEEGTPVVDGKTVLAKVDDLWCRLAAERCRAQIASLEAQLVYESAELRRYASLRQTDAASESEYEAKRATDADLRAKLEEAKARLEEEVERQKRSVILAPFDGTVVAKQAELGGYVSPGSPIVDVVSRGQVDAQLMVPESMINFLKVDQTLMIRVDPLGDEVSGKVISITPYGPSASRTFPVRVRLDDQAGRLKVGMSVTAMIATAATRKALVVTRDAVLVRPDGSTVWVAGPSNEGKAIEVQPVPVQISARMSQEYAVESETAQGRKLLVPGARVVIEGAERLSPGQEVRIVTLDGQAASLEHPQGPQRPAHPTAADQTPAASSGRGEG